MFRKKRRNILLLSFFDIRTLSKNWLDFAKKKFGEFVKTACYAFTRTFCSKIGFMANSFFFRNLGNTFPCFRPIIYRKVVKAIFYMFRQHFVETDFFKPFLFLVHNLTLSTNFLRFGWNFSSKWQSFLRIQTKTLMENTFFDKFSFFWILVETFSDFRQKFLRKVVKTVFYVFMKYFDEINSLIFMFLVHIWTLSENFLTFD